MGARPACVEQNLGKIDNWCDVQFLHKKMYIGLLYFWGPANLRTSNKFCVWSLRTCFGGAVSENRQTLANRTHTQKKRPIWQQRRQEMLPTQVEILGLIFQMFFHVLVKCMNWRTRKQHKNLKPESCNSHKTLSTVNWHLQMASVLVSSMLFLLSSNFAHFITKVKTWRVWFRVHLTRGRWRRPAARRAPGSERA